ncbi:MAG: hypothetical protein A3F40_02265 [Chlamydiae bacterium RIFCSPHIGHO2_12_FULL_27_8]|nr:MAG: hypothetical protein A3F40_02265 [Chlamydiae bacterium RIFCSPHIGHO2_12_FULL_27_8]
MFIIQKGEGKPISETALENIKIDVFNANISPDNVIFGGCILNLVNDLAHKVAKNHCETKCLTIGIDFIRYYSLIKKDDILLAFASVNRVWDKIIEVGVKVIAEDFRLLDQKKILSAYFTFNSIDDSNNVIKIKTAIPETKQQKIRYMEANKRKVIREKKSQL